MFLGRTWAAVCSAPGFWTCSWLFVARNPNPVFGTLIQLVVVKKPRLCKPENWMCSFGVFPGALGFLQRFTGFPGGVFLPAGGSDAAMPSSRAQVAGFT